MAEMGRRGGKAGGPQHARPAAPGYQTIAGWAARGPGASLARLRAGFWRSGSCGGAGLAWAPA